MCMMKQCEGDVNTEGEKDYDPCVEILEAAKGRGSWQTGIIKIKKIAC